MDKETILNQIKAFPFWYHKIDLGNGIITPGWAPLNSSFYRIPENLSGKRVLDVGSWDGYWAFEALKRGAKEVVAVDNFSDYLGKLQSSDRKEWETFDFCKKIFGYNDEQCKRYNMDVMDIDKLGEFDVVFFFGTFYHLKHPFYVLEKLSKICKEELYIETAICDDLCIYSKTGYGDKPVMEFYPGNEYGNNNSNWFVPTLACVGKMVHACNFTKIDGWKIENPTHLTTARGFIKARKTHVHQV